MDLEQLVQRINSTSSPYQILGVDRSAGHHEIKAAFQLLTDNLYPHYDVNKSFPPSIASEIDRAFQRVSQAFATLASFNRRREYDRALSSSDVSAPGGSMPASKPATIPTQPTTGRPTKTQRSVATAGNADGGEGIEVSSDRMHRRNEAFSETTIQVTRDNRRRCPRIRMSLPARVNGWERESGKWIEMTETVDVSRTGVRLRIRRNVKPGTILHVTLPLPTKLRSHAFSDSSYGVYSFVRRVEPASQGFHSIGLEFIGEHPPPGFLENPWLQFKVKRWAGGERRRRARHDKTEQVGIEYVDDQKRTLRTERARTENISQSGLRLVGTRSPEEFDHMILTCERLKFRSRAALRSKFKGKDGFERLCLHLLDSEWPSSHKR